MVARLLLLIVSLALVLGFSELILSRAAPQRTEQHILSQRAPMFQESDTFISELRPGFVGREREGTGEFDMEVSINSAGYRGPELAPAKGDALRVLAVGDSFTFGHGVQAEEAGAATLRSGPHDRSGARVAAGARPRR